MTKEETKNAIEVMQGFCNGKTIQVRFKNQDDNWDDTQHPCWDWTVNDYRIKPEKYVRPYTFNEMQEAVKKHGGYVHQNDTSMYGIIFFNEEGIELSGTAHCTYTYAELVENGFIWMDDKSFCGILEFSQ